jgi:hypothetical protein
MYSSRKSSVKVDYVTIKNIVLRSLQNIAKEETLKTRAYMPQNAIFDFQDNDDHSVNVNKLLAPPSPLLNLKIKNTTKYLNWRLSILKRDYFTCKICHASVKANKSLRLEVHHAKSFDDIL